MKNAIIAMLALALLVEVNSRAFAQQKNEEAEQWRKTAYLWMENYYAIKGKLSACESKASPRWVALREAPDAR